MKMTEGKLVSDGMKVAIVAARFNEFIVSNLIEGARKIFRWHGFQAHLKFQ